MDDSHTFHPNYPPYLKVKLAEEFRYIDQIKRRNRPIGVDHGYSNTIINYFISPSDTSDSETKLVFLYKHNIETTGVYYEHLGHLNYPQIIESGEVQLGGATYQYGIGWNFLPFGGEDIQFIEENMGTKGEAMPRYILTKFFRRITGSARNGIITICYAEAIPTNLSYLKINQGKAALTQDQKTFVARFEQRCGNNVFVQ
jgi:hypothetical protein